MCHAFINLYRGLSKAVALKESAPWHLRVHDVSSGVATLLSKCCDRLILDLIGMAVLKKALDGDTVDIIFNNKHLHWWGAYNLPLFQSPNVDMVTAVDHYKLSRKKVALQWTKS